MSKGLKQLDIDELYHLSAQIEENPEHVASLLFPDEPSYRVPLTKQIGAWAINQTIALESIQKNKHDVAIIFNKAGDRIWQQLPGFAQSVMVSVL